MYETNNLDECVRTIENIVNNYDYYSTFSKNLYDDLKDDEYVHLDDSSGDLSGEVVSKIEYVRRMLKSAIREENWSKVENTILFIDAMIKP